MTYDEIEDIIKESNQRGDESNRFLIAAQSKLPPDKNMFKYLDSIKNLPNHKHPADREDKKAELNCLSVSLLTPLI